jgi:hypothetical protein
MLDRSFKCDANFVLDDLGNGEYYEFAGGPRQQTLF